MPTSAAVDATVERFPNPSLPNHSGKPNYTVIKETHQLLKVNAAFVECDLGRVQNGYLGLIFLPEQYAQVSRTYFVLLPDSGQTAHLQAWITNMEEKRVLREIHGTETETAVQRLQDFRRGPQELAARVLGRPIPVHIK